MSLIVRRDLKMKIPPLVEQGNKDLRDVKVHPNIHQPDLPVHCEVYRIL